MRFAHAPILALLALGSACGPGRGAAGLSDVAQFRGGPAHPGVTETAAGTAYGGLLWKARTGGPVRSSPVVTGGVV